MMKNVATVGITEIRQSSTGDLILLDKVTRPAVIVSTVSRKLTIGATPGSGMFSS
jgi:hypothetical protein